MSDVEAVASHARGARALNSKVLDLQKPMALFMADISGLGPRLARQTLPGGWRGSDNSDRHGSQTVGLMLADC